MKPSRLYAVLVTLSMLTIGLAAVAPSAGAQDAPEVQGNCYDGDGDDVAVSVAGENVHGDHEGDNAVDANVWTDQEEYSSDDDDLVDADVGQPHQASNELPGDLGYDRQRSGSDCDTVDADVLSYSIHGKAVESNDYEDNDTVDADVDTYNNPKNGGEAYDDDGVDADVSSFDTYSGDSYSDDDTVDADIAHKNADLHPIEGEHSDDDTVEVSILSTDHREDSKFGDEWQYDSDDDTVWVNCGGEVEIRPPFFWDDPGVKADPSCNAQYEEEKVPNHP